MELPKWANTPSDPLQARRNALEFKLRTAALAHNRSGSIRLMVDGLCTYEAIVSSIKRGYFSAPMAAALEGLCGKDVLDKDFLMNATESGDVDA